MSTCIDQIYVTRHPHSARGQVMLQYRFEPLWFITLYWAQMTLGYISNLSFIKNQV